MASEKQSPDEVAARAWAQSEPKVTVDLVFFKSDGTRVFDTDTGDFAARVSLRTIPDRGDGVWLGSPSMDPDGKIALVGSMRQFRVVDRSLSIINFAGDGEVITLFLRAVV